MTYNLSIYSGRNAGHLDNFVSSMSRPLQQWGEAKLILGELNKQFHLDLSCAVLRCVA